ncbi:serine hydrolase [Steroidobacter flavus]|uniref:Beta-lactamase n=1 Tax=Steroidobacter flavus TaxID=1842136 RepID=A0ABV8SZ68_9GAMM
MKTSWLAAAVLITSVYGATARAEPSLASLDPYIQRAVQEWRVPGVAVGLIHGGKTVWSKGYGAREVGKAPRVDAHTLFEIGSLSKAFTAAAIAILVDEGKLRWDDAVIDHLPTFQVADPWLTRQITIRDLVSGRTGVEGGVPALVPMDTRGVVRLAAHLQSQSGFRDSLLYSNVMYDIAGEVVEAVSGLSWAEFLQRRIFAPLRMDESSPSADTAGFWDADELAPSMYGQARAGVVSIEDAPNANVAMPHWQTPGGLKALPWQISHAGGAGSGSVVSSLDDLLKWVRFNLGDGRAADSRVLMQRQTLDQLHTPQIFVRKPPSSSFTLVKAAIDAVSPSDRQASYAMGWFVQGYRGYSLVNHGGALLGGSSLIVMLPERDLAVVVMANSYGRDGQGLMNWAIALRALDALLAVDRHDWSADLLQGVQQRDSEANAAETRVQQSRLKGTRPSLSLTGYAGAYQNAQFGHIRVDVKGSELVLRLPGVFEWRLEHWHNDTFRLHVATSGVELMRFFVTFDVGPAAKVRSFDPGWLVFGGPFLPSPDASS